MRPSLRRPLRRAVAALAGFARPRMDGPLVRILTYHRVNDAHPRDRLTVHPRAFAAQMEELRATRSVITVEEAVSALRGDRPIPAGAVAITFDDGYRDNFTFAVPILEQFGFSATFFIATGYMGTPATLDRYRGCCSQDGMLDWDEVGAMRSRGHAIGGHGREHLELARLAPAAARAEIEGCQEDIGKRLGAPASLFCYPRGSETKDVRRLVAGAGFQAACTVEPGGNGIATDLLGLRRTEVSGDDELADFRLKLDGEFDGWHRLMQLSQAWRVA
jgi:peptidoglycan/xylan/chitin deacetylase (PgdA/CDA1 family)